MNPETVKHAIKINKLLNKAVSFSSIDSTNKYLLSGDFASGTIASASEQTAGRGKHGAKWVSARGGLWFSYVINKKILRPYIYVILASVAVVEALKAVKIKAEIKWPNDILVNGKKICGILIENDTYNKKLVTGIGLNVNNPVPADTAVSVKMLIKKEAGLESIFLAIIKNLDRYISPLSGMKKKLISSWIKAQANMEGKAISLMRAGVKRVYIVLKVNKDGTITAMDEKGKKRVLKGEIFFI